MSTIRSAWMCGALGLTLLAPQNSHAERNSVRIGALSGPITQILEVVQEVAAENGLPIEIVRFDDLDKLTEALESGNLEADEEPNAPSLEIQVKQHGYKLTQVAYTVTQPMGIYSSKIASLTGLKWGDRIAIAANPVDGPRALILLHNCGLLGLRDGAGLNATVADITENPKNLQIIEIPAEDMQTSLQLVAAVVMPFSTATNLVLYPARDSLVIEDGHSPYAGILAVKDEDKDAPWVSQLIKAYHSEKVKAFILSQFNGSVRRPW
jgi:D-methionine transport system substrate-binding protein